jgi:lipopolysaccharide export system permease protein
VTPLFSTFDRHVIRRLLSTYGLLVAALVVFFVVLHLVEYIDDFMDRGADPMSVILVYYPNYVPEIIRLISPLALFMSCVYLTGVFAQKLQLMSLETAGVPLRRIMRPYVVVAIGITLFMFWFNGYVVPETNRLRIQFELQYTKDGSTGTEYNNIHRQTSRGGVLSVGFYDRATDTAHTVTLQRYDDARHLRERIDSPRMIWTDSIGTWRMLNPVIRRFDQQGIERQQRPQFVDTTLTLRPRDMARTDGDVDAMTIPEAKNYLDTLRRSGADHLGRPLVAFHSKFAYPFANLILVLLGVPLASVRRRGGQSVVIALGLFTAFAYLSIQKILEPLGYSGTLTPWMAAWLPHLIFLAGSLIALRRTKT